MPAASTTSKTTLISFLLATSVLVVLYAPWHPPGWEDWSFVLALGLVFLGGYVAWRSTAGDPLGKRLSSLSGVCFFASAVCFTHDTHPFGEEGILVLLSFTFLSLGGYFTWRAQLRA